MRRRWLWILAAGIAAGIALSGLYKHFVTDRNAAPALPDIPADAALLALDWTQNGGESMEGSFVFILTAENGAYTLSDGEDSIPLTDSQWRQVEQTLRAGAHTAPVELPEGVEESITPEGRTCVYTCPISDTQTLAVEVRLEGANYDILRWQAVSTADWELDETLDLWDGDPVTDLGES